MGVGVSSWRLANTVARAGQLGVVSGSMLDTVLVRRLQDGDPDGHVRRAAAHFPIPGVAERILNRYFRHRGRPAGTSTSSARNTTEPSGLRISLVVSRNSTPAYGD